MSATSIGWAFVALRLVPTPSAGASTDGGGTESIPVTPKRPARVEGPLIEAPRRITTNQDTIDFTGKVGGLLKQDWAMRSVRLRIRLTRAAAEG